MSDGTLMIVRYTGQWKITLLKAGSLYVRIDQCPADYEDNYTDAAHFKKGITSAYKATNWEKVN